MKLWEFWIDVGGTFTDCIARSPDDRLVQHKLLSSGVTKGQVAEITGPVRFSDPARCVDPPRFWIGYQLQMLDADARVCFSTRIAGFDQRTGTFTTEALLPTNLEAETRYELSSGEESPVVAVRYILGKQLEETLPLVSVRLGTTRGTNALLTRRGARTAFVTTRGFADVLLIANQDRPRLFDLAIKKPEPLFEQVLEIDERVSVDGEVLKAPDEKVVRSEFERLKQSGIESIAICLLHSFAHPEHERLVERCAREAGFTEISTSSKLSPLIKIVSRGDTTVVDAYLNPILRHYVQTLRKSLGGSHVELREQNPYPAKFTLTDFRDQIRQIRKMGPLRNVMRTIPGMRKHTEGMSSEADPDRELDQIEGMINSMTPHERENPELIEPSRRGSIAQDAGVDASSIDKLLKDFSVIADMMTEIASMTKTKVNGAATPRLRLMTSAGGLVDADRFVGKDSILSGPAGGVIGFSRIAQRAGFERSIGFDMGGTSTDVSRFDGRYELEYETRKAGVRVVAPMLAIETVAAGGGSICEFDGVKLTVGPQSAGAQPGPACYGRGGPLTVTDINLYLGKIIPARFPFPLDRPAVEEHLNRLCERIAQSTGGQRYTPSELAEGFVRVANANMVRPIRAISVAKGYDPRDYVLVTFGGAGAQHACAIARELGMRQVLSHPLSGLLSAYGIGLADVRRFGEQGILKPYTHTRLLELEAVFQALESRAIEEVLAEGLEQTDLAPPARSLDLRFQGVEATINVPCPADGDYERRYIELHQQLYGYVHTNRTIEITAARVEVVGRMPEPPDDRIEPQTRRPEPHETTETWFDGKPQRTGIFLREQLHPGDELTGPCIVCEPSSTVVIDPGFTATILERGEILITDSGTQAQQQISTEADPVQLEIFNNLFASIAEQMGITLQRTSFSTNVKERLDFSCAIFSPTGDLVVNAPHIPVHLGAMGETVKRILSDNPRILPGDVFVTNDPYRGGSHLPDVTVVTPVHHAETKELLFFTASRAHHAEIGGIVPGSMPPFSKNLSEEGVLIRNFKLVDAGVSREEELRQLLLSGKYPTRSVRDNLADVSAEVAANNSGVARLNELVEHYSLAVVQAYMQHIQAAAEHKMRLALAAFPDGTYVRTEHLDDGAVIHVAITVAGDSAVVDFTGTGPVLAGNLNANRAIVTAAVLYVFRCLINADTPLNSGVLAPVRIIIPPSLLCPPEHDDPAQCAAMVGGNVETSQRVVDTLLGALGVAAASQGTMNNLTFGDATFGYYETICGGSGATATSDGADAVHTHMTNTRLTDPEVIERRYPVRVHEFSIRRGSGGAGKHRGGDGVIRRLEFLRTLRVSILSERRGPYAPFGLQGGAPGALGKNSLIKAGGAEETDLGGKVQIEVQAGDVLTIQTPGGGGFGST